jgi:hypothetical protein
MTPYTSDVNGNIPKSQILLNALELLHYAYIL